MEVCLFHHFSIMKTTLKLLRLYPPKDKRSDRDHHFVKNFFHIGWFCSKRPLCFLWKKFKPEKEEKVCINFFWLSELILSHYPFCTSDVSDHSELIILSTIIRNQIDYKRYSLFSEKDNKMFLENNYQKELLTNVFVRIKKSIQNL